jgi:pectate lyase
MTLRRRQQITARTVLPKPRHRHRRRTSVGAVAATTVVAATVVAASGVVSSGALTGSEGTVATTSYARHFAAASVMLADRAGFGRSTTGGYLGRMIHVTTAADDGPGSLRAAVAGSTPAWVVFDDDFKIRLAKGLEVGSNKTIDGRGRHVTITGHGTDGLIIDGVSNVIVSNLTLTDFGDVALTKDNDKPDAIHVRRAKNVWIDHNDLSVAGDKLISIDNGSAGVTVSWNHFHDQQQVFQIGSQLTAKAAGDRASQLLRPDRLPQPGAQLRQGARLQQLRLRLVDLWRPIAATRAAIPGEERLPGDQEPPRL